MKEDIRTIIKWHEETFPDATLDGQRTKFEEELNEYRQDKTMMELADMFIVACGIARFDSIAALEYFSVVFKALLEWKIIGAWGVLQEVVNTKMAKNRKRVWAKTDEGTYHHILQSGKKITKKAQK